MGRSEVGQWGVAMPYRQFRNAGDQQRRLDSFRFSASGHGQHDERGGHSIRSYGTARAYIADSSTDSSLPHLNAGWSNAWLGVLAAFPRAYRTSPARQSSS